MFQAAKQKRAKPIPNDPAVFYANINNGQKTKQTIYK